MQKFRREMEKKCPLLFKVWRSEASNQGIPLSNSSNLQLETFLLHNLKTGEIHMMSQEIINFNQEKYEVLNYKMKTHKIYVKNTTNLTKAKKFVYVASPNMSSYWAWKQITIEQQRHKISSK